jgi:hypothetical protein
LLAVHHPRRVLTLTAIMASPMGRSVTTSERAACGVQERTLLARGIVGSWASYVNVCLASIPRWGRCDGVTLSGKHSGPPRTCVFALFVSC